MKNTQPSQTPVIHDINVIAVSPEEASFGVPEFWLGDRQIAFTRTEDSELTLRIGASHDELVLGANALAEPLAEAKRLLALY